MSVRTTKVSSFVTPIHSDVSDPNLSLIDHQLLKQAVYLDDSAETLDFAHGGDQAQIAGTHAEASGSRVTDGLLKRIWSIGVRPRGKGYWLPSSSMFSSCSNADLQPIAVVSTSALSTSPRLKNWRG